MNTLNCRLHIAIEHNLSSSIKFEDEWKLFLNFFCQTRKAEFQSIGLLGSFRKIAKTEGVLELRTVFKSVNGDTVIIVLGASN